MKKDIWEWVEIVLLVLVIGTIIYMSYVL